MIEQPTCKMFLFFALAVTQVSSEIFFEKGSPHVKLNNNTVISGCMDYSREGRPFSSFMGIPYATIPGRFKESQLVKYPPTSEVKSFTEHAPVCTQLYFGKMLGKEDCLNLNIFVPMNNTGDSKGYPVMVWVHGGGFMLGNGYGNGAKYLMDESIILITFDYRLGVFGFLSTGDNIVPGNGGLKDMVVLLKWVQEHVSKFGGNKEKVTIFGESAGGAAVHYLTLSPLTKGLFRRAICQSVSATTLFASDPDPKSNAVQLATYLKCPTTANEPSGITSEEILNCLKDLPEEVLNKAQFQYRQCWPPFVRPFFFVPVAEPEGTPNAFLTESPAVILADKNRPLKNIPLLIGANEDEGATFYAGIVSENPDLLKQLNKDWDNVVPLAFEYGRFPITPQQKQTISNKIRRFYFGSEDEPITLEKHRKNLTNLFGDQLAIHSVHKAAVETAARNEGGPVYLYQYAYRGPLSVMGLGFNLKGEETKMVAHVDDLQHLFDLSDELFPGTSKAIKSGSPDEEFSKNFVRLWASFAIHGEPKYMWGTGLANGEHSLERKSLSSKDVKGTHPTRWFRIDSNPRIVEDPYKERIQFWDDLFQQYFTPMFTEIGALGKGSLKM